MKSTSRFAAKAFQVVRRSVMIHCLVICMAFGITLLCGRAYWIAEGMAMAPVKVVTVHAPPLPPQIQIVKKYVRLKCRAEPSALKGLF